MNSLLFGALTSLSVDSGAAVPDHNGFGLLLLV